MSEEHGLLGWLKPGSSAKPNNSPLQQVTSKQTRNTGSSQAAKYQMSWSEALLPYVDHPATTPGVVYYDEVLVVAEDKYPKGRKHFLVMPRCHIHGVSQLTRGELPLLNAMKERADILVRENESQDPRLKFKIGFHAIPSMRQLHMHVVTRDMLYVKNKKHWNSFNTEFFKPFEEIVDLLESAGCVKYDKNFYEEMLKRNLRCCGKEYKTIPALKVHLEHGHVL
ncbi:HIT-like protein [Gonapodya prolifera JEL478]|uniref:HIT-like protein n=1 Tax=Gonapodya prolifera (strain JEL478) TaxID=1344416 RepID=A0A139APQ5_GONPJ|nr:HIT-like protein [Gonapodya prolifera JEL478]|eukprot:KXS18475.1 HIT-like protein [Gonapodya prolifera JEL478]